jgi:hypothetical protein
MILPSLCRRSFVAVCALLVELSLTAVHAPAAGPAGEETAVVDYYPTRANGKQVVRAGDRWLVVIPDPSGHHATLAIALRDAALEFGRGWEQVPFLAPDDRGLFRSTAGGRFRVPPSLAVDRAGRIHAAWDSGDAVWYARTTSAAARSGTSLGARGSWIGADGREPKPVLASAVLGDFTVTGQGEVVIAAVKRATEGPTTLCLARNTGSSTWEIEDLARGTGFHPPVLHMNPDRSMHLAWSTTRGEILDLEYRRGAKAHPHIICKGGYYPNGRNPAIVACGQQTLVAYETLYAQIEYAVQDDGKWQPPTRFTSLDKRFATDVLHSPQLVLDRHGVVWLFFSDATRRFTYFTRWLGSGWSDIYDGRGIYYRAPRFETNLLGADWLGVEKYPPPDAGEIGISLANSLAPDKKEFHRIGIPAPAVDRGSSTLFLDLLETARADGLEQILEEAQKHPKNPILTQGRPGSFDQDRVFNHGSVIHDGSKFRMWYGGVWNKKGVYWWERLTIGYAESADGVNWSKFPTHAPGTENGPNFNQLPALPWPSIAFKDPNDPDPSRRYKMVQFDRHQRQLMAALRGEYDMDAPTCPGRLHVSADGIQWSSEPITLSFPDGKLWEFVVQSFFIDPAEPDPARRWKAYGYASVVARRRAGCFAYSGDGRNWICYPRNPILDPTVSEVPMVPAGPEAQIHDTIVFPYEGYYLALFHAEHDSYFLDVELAVSRDGTNFAHVKPGRKVIPGGAHGAWDWQQILQSAPVAAADKLWIYYGGQAPPPEQMARRELNNEALIGAAGLANLRLDGFTHMRLRPGVTSGALTTVPFQVRTTDPLHLEVNLECEPDAMLRAELLDPATGQPIGGFSRDECEPIADGPHSVVHWRGQDRLPLSGRKQLAFRFLLTAREQSPKLYAFRFAPAAPAAAGGAGGGNVP